MRSMRHLLCSGVLLLPLLGSAQQSTTSSPDSPSKSTPQDPALSHRQPKQNLVPGAIALPGRIQLDAVVHDASGHPVSGLDPWDFKILDDNLPRKILTFHAFDGVNSKPNPPVQIILAVDVANLPFTQVAFARQQLIKFLLQNDGHLAQPTTIVLITDAGIRVQPRPSTDGKALVAAVNQINGSINTINPAMGDQGMLQRFQLSVRQLTTIAESESLSPGRKLVIWLGPGWPLLDSAKFVSAPKDQQRYFDAIVELSTKLREAHVVLDSVSPAGAPADSGTRPFLYQAFLKGVKTPSQADSGNLSLKVLVTQTGGLILGPDNDLTAQINACIAEANSFYSFSFDPPPAERANEYHDLRLTIDKPGLTARTFTGYYNQPIKQPKD